MLSAAWHSTRRSARSCKIRRSFASSREPFRRRLVWPGTSVHDHAASEKLADRVAILLPCPLAVEGLLPRASGGKLAKNPLPEKGRGFFFGVVPPSTGKNNARRALVAVRRHIASQLCRADVSCGKVAVKSRRRRRSGLMSMTESATDDLTRDCPRDAAHETPPPPKKARGRQFRGETLCRPRRGVGLVAVWIILITLFNLI